MKDILNVFNNKNNMEVKREIIKKNYTMTKSKSAVQKNKANTDKVFKAIMDKLASLNQQNENKGQVKSVKDGVAQISGLRSVKVGEIIEFSSKRGQKTTYGMALNLEKKSVGCVIFGEDRQIKQNDLVIGRGRLLDIEINKNVLGRALNALGHPIDGKGKIASSKIRIKVERKAPVLLLESL